MTWSEEMEAYGSGKDSWYEVIQLFRTWGVIRWTGKTFFDRKETVRLLDGPYTTKEEAEVVARRAASDEMHS